MRKLITLTLLFITIAGYTQRSFHGYVLGFNMAYLTGDSTILDNKSPRIGFYGGLFWDIIISGESFLQIGVTYSQQGVTFYSEYFEEGLFRREKVVHQVDYIHIPIVWKQLWGQVYTELGGYLAAIPITPKAYWQKETFYPDSIHLISGNYYSFAKNIQLFDVGAVFGIGFQTRLSAKYDIFFNIRYKPGFIVLDKEIIRPEYRMRNQVFTFSMGLISIGEAARHNRYSIKRKR